MANKAKLSIGLTLISLKSELIRSNQLSFLMIYGICSWCHENFVLSLSHCDEFFQSDNLYPHYFAGTHIRDSVFSYSLCSGGLAFIFLTFKSYRKNYVFSYLQSWICYAGSEAITSTQSLVLGSLHSDIEAALYLEG